MVVDSGVATYEAGPLRAYCRSTRAHNTVEIEGRDQVELWGAFRAGRRCRPREVVWTPQDGAFELSARHDGYRVLPGRGLSGLPEPPPAGRADGRDGARLDELRAAAAAARVDNVVFTGRLEREAIPAVLATSDAGLPLVLGVRGFAQRFVEDAGCGVCIAPGDADELVEAVLRLADDPALRRRLGQAGRALAARFDRDRLAARYLEIVRATRPAFR